MNVTTNGSRHDLVKVQDLVKHFPVRGGLFRRVQAWVRAVDGVSFDIAPGELVGYIGPNGAGKSTTLKMLTGLLVPTGGEHAFGTVSAAPPPHPTAAR